MAKRNQDASRSPNPNGKIRTTNRLCPLQSNRMLEVRWGRTLVLSNVYDQFGRLVQQTDRDSRRFSYSYDASNGQMDMAHLKLPDGFVTHFYFQSAGGVTQSLPVRDHNASLIP